MKYPLLIDRKFRLPRVWSNAELRKFAHLFEGDIVNVSAWQDADKEGHTYKSYFTKSASYTITNYKSDARGFQGSDGEIFLDLTAPLPSELEGRFDVVFNHTCLEHIFEVEKAFENLCRMSSDIVITVVPFLQQMHTDYGDFWRFTPTAIQKLFAKNGMEVLYSSFNSDVSASVYIFTVATRNRSKWQREINNLTPSGDVITFEKPVMPDFYDPMVGSNAIFNPGDYIKALSLRIKALFKRNHTK
ncbi:MAG: hypothetical protein DI626_04725 [Micavibrio aeruginosavorus]|uniref:Methyltransferase type 11 domain-containing protein n=1 Tax=Micavibrio aeruginosavorus TaxID=349221 RepID=A0A2W5BZC0_9BACT|nr:MAG: hypothetical protein DI626_04725 [Micavibrio aeruginosavorus]